MPRAVLAWPSWRFRRASGYAIWRWTYRRSCWRELADARAFLDSARLSSSRATQNAFRLITAASIFPLILGASLHVHTGAAVRNIARCLRRGGRVVGAMICRGPSLRQRLILRPGTRSFGPGGTVDELAHWLAAAGLKQTRLEVSGALAYFEASA